MIKIPLGFAAGGRGEPFLLFVAFWLWVPGVSGAREPVDLDEVYCALCHYEEGDDFAASIHYQRGLLLCNDCHGGLPFAEDAEIAKAPGTGFIGKPERGDIADVCGRCHSGPADFFARSPHGEWQDQDNPSCITCHHNHRVVDATLGLMEQTCVICHQLGTAALELGDRMRRELETSGTHLDRVAAELDSLAQLDPGLRRALPYIDAARSALREADPITHAVEFELVEEKVHEFRGQVEGAEALIAGYYEKGIRRRWAVMLIWGLVAVNVALLWWRRQLG